MQNVQPDQPVYELETLDAMTSETLTFRSRMLTLLSLFAGAALVLACIGIGIYGVMAYSVNQRMREMGIRLALGAAGRDVVRLVVGDGLKVVMLGLGLGAIGAGFASQLLRSQLYDVDRLDPATHIAVAMVLLAAGTAACLLPARRAARVDPMISLRSE